jgi:hypothetical protein
MARVRIRKAGPGEKAGYYNKASLFLKKAQMGTEVQATQDQASAQNDQEAILKAYYEYAYDQLIKDVPIDNVLGELVKKGLPKQIAYDLVNSLVQELTDRGQLNPDNKRAQEQEVSQKEQAQAEGNQTIIDDWKENYGPNASSDQQEEDQSMYEEDQDMADLEEGYITDDSHLMAKGGFFDEGGINNPTIQQYDDVRRVDANKFDFQKLIEETPGVQPGLNFPSLKEYIPAFSGNSWQEVEALDEPLYRKGGNVPSKKQFVKNVMSPLKKQDGGEQGEQKLQTLGKGPRMDTLTEDVKKHRDNFLGAIKEKATKVKTEEMYDKLMQSNDPEMQQLGMQGQQEPMEQPFQMGGYTGGEDPLYKFIGGGMELDTSANVNPPYYEADYLPEAKYGHSVGNLIRAARGLSGPRGMNPDEFPPKQTEQPTAPKPQADVQMKPEEEIRIATPRYVPTYGGYTGPWHRNLTPWNPLVSRSMQMIGSPYIAGTRTPYRDPLQGLTPVARQVTKRGLFGQPKRYTDFYAAIQMAGSPLPYQGKQMLLADNNMLRFINPLSNLETGIPDFDFSNTKGLGLRSKAAIRAGELEQMRNQRRLERNPELLESSVSQIPYVNTSYLPDPATTDQRVFDQNDPNFLMQPWEGPVNINEIPGGSAMTAFAYGGSLNRFIPKAAPGIQVQDPNLPQPAPANPDMVMGAQPGLLGKPVQGPGTLWNAQASFNAPAPTSSAVTSYNSNPMNNMAVEPAGEDLTNCTPEQKRDATSKCYCSPEARKDPNNKRCFESLIAADVRQTTIVDPEALLNVGNAGVRGVTGLLNRRDQRRQEQQMYDNMTTDNLYASQGTRMRGHWTDFGSAAGMFDPANTGQDRSGFSSYGKYGGYMQKGGELDYLSAPDFPVANYNEDDEVYMSDEDIQNFMANGGQIEYLED